MAEQAAWILTFWVCLLASPLISCATLGSSFNLSVPRFSYLQNGTNNGVKA